MSRTRLLITSGPTREYLDPVRYLSNGSSGQMGSCLAASALKAGYAVTLITGPVSVDYPEDAEVVKVVTTQEMLDAVLEYWPESAGMIAAAAPCDFRPATFSESKIKKSDSKTHPIELIENPDILSEVGAQKDISQWTIGFALETDNGPENAVRKLRQKNCDYIVLNEPSAIDSENNSVSIFDTTGSCVDDISGSKQTIADRILALKPL